MGSSGGIPKCGAIFSGALMQYEELYIAPGPSNGDPATPASG
jgi:hypothetical protein